MVGLACLGLLTAVLLTAQPFPAHAAEGHRARWSLTVTLDDSFLRSSGAPQIGPLTPGAFTIPPISGMLYRSGALLRVDMTLPQDGGVVTTLYDAASSTVWVLDHSEQVSWRSELPAVAAADAPLFNLEQFAGQWPLWERELRAREGISVRDIGRRRVNGLDGRGMRLSGDLSRVISADEVALLPGLPHLRDLSGPWNATIWVSDALALPVKLTSSWRGMTMVWQMAGVETWTPPAMFFQVPPGYRERELRD